MFTPVLAKALGPGPVSLAVSSVIGKVFLDSTRLLLPSDGSHLGQIGNEQSTGDGLSLLRAYYRRFSLVWLDTDPVVDGAAQLSAHPR